MRRIYFTIIGGRPKPEQCLYQGDFGERERYGESPSDWVKRSPSLPIELIALRIVRTTTLCRSDVINIQGIQFSILDQFVFLPSEGKDISVSKMVTFGKIAVFAWLSRLPEASYVSESNSSSH